MKIVVFGLSVTSSWGNGHATLWRGLIRALVRRGCRVVFFERNQSFYAVTRDLTTIRGAQIIIYDDWSAVSDRARIELRDAEAGIVTSFCPDGAKAGALLRNQHRALPVYYDLDTPVSLDALSGGVPLPWLGDDGLAGYQLALSFTGGPALEMLQTRLQARRTATLYGHVDPTVHHRVPSQPHLTCDLSYLGTFAADRQQMLEQLFVEPARLTPQRKFIVAGAQYPDTFPWTRNIYFLRHLPPQDHPAFFSSSRATLNVTRAAMARMGWCPSGRLFEAAACGAAMISDTWAGLDAFFAPGREIMTATSQEDVRSILSLSDRELHNIGEAARARVLSAHTCDHRAGELIDVLTHLPAEPRLAAAGLR